MPFSRKYEVAALFVVALFASAWSWQNLPPDAQVAVTRSRQALLEHKLDLSSYHVGPIMHIESHSRKEDNPWTICWEANGPDQIPQVFWVDVFPDGRVVFKLKMI